MCPPVDDIDRKGPKISQLDQESIFTVAINIIDSNHHFKFHVFQSVLRDIAENASVVQNDDDQPAEKHEFYDRSHASIHQINSIPRLVLIILSIIYLIRFSLYEID